MLEVEVSEEIIEVEIPPEIPRKLNSTTSVRGVRFLAGEGAKLKRVMFVATAVLEEEITSQEKMTYTEQVLKVKPRYLKGPGGVILRDLAKSAGVDFDECYYTAAVKWLLPKGKRLQPSADSMKAAFRLLEQEIAEVDPEIIVCMGKPVFDLLSGTKFKLRDVVGGWFQAKLASRTRLLYPMYDVTKPVTKPEMIEVFRKDFNEIRRMMLKQDGTYIPDYEEKYEVIRNSDELRELVSRLREDNREILSVDCEWHGQNHVDGLLRSIQICWAPGEAAYVYFRSPDEDMTYTFDVDYKEAGKILSEWLDQPHVKYVGQHISADLPWMAHVLGLEWYDKCLLDTEFAQQCVDEHEELGLERLAMTYTDLGRYDVDLTLWCKKNGKLVEDGYGRVPDDILIPYANRDVDAVMRSYQKIMLRMMMDTGGHLYEYYASMFNGFVSDVFTNFCLFGLPVDSARIDGLRDLYQWARKELDTEFREEVARESEKLLLKTLVDNMQTPEAEDPLLREYLQEPSDEVADVILKSAPAEFFGKLAEHTQKAAEAYESLQDMLRDGKSPDALWSALKGLCGVERMHAYKPVFDHWLQAPGFNVNSTDHMRRWLFDVKGYKPVKSTNQKEKGLPSMDWEKIEQLPPDKQKEFKPSTDKQSLAILQAKYDDPLLTRLMDFKNVGTVCKSFLGEPDQDENGNIIREKGLHSYVASDGILYGNFSTTETGRPRSWQPNTLNLPGWVNGSINGAIHGILEKRHKQGRAPEAFHKYLEKDESGKYDHKIPSVRSIVSAPEGWCIVESDYQTAELRAWAFISGCQDMIDLITLPDPNFAKVKPEAMVDDDTVCRLAFPAFLKVDDPEKYRMKYVVEGVVKAEFTEDDLLRDEDGNIVHAKQDLHWGLAEQQLSEPREVLINKRDRGAAKVGNFSCLAYDTPINTEDGVEEIANLLPCQKVWDGVEWVSHEGNQNQGDRYVITYDGLRATPDHVVWTERGKMCVGDAAIRGVSLQRPEGTLPSDALSRHETAVRKRYARIQPQLQGSRNRSTFSVRERVRGVGPRKVARLGLQRSGLRQDRQRRTLFSGKSSVGSSFCKPAEYQNLRRVFAVKSRGLPRRVPIRDLYVSDCVESDADWQNCRGDSSKVRRGRSAAGEEKAEGRSPQRGSRVESQEPGSLAVRQGGSFLDQQGDVRRGYHQEGYGTQTGNYQTDDDEAWIERQRSHYSKVDSEGQDGARARRALRLRGFKLEKLPVYDVINAGPRNRFCANGRLVSNSAYGATGPTLERKIEGDTGIKPEPGTGDAILDALMARQPRAFEFMFEMESAPTDPGYISAASGRVRHFYLHPRNLPGLNERMQKGIISALGREARNFKCQESVAATAIRAVNFLLRFKRKFGLQGRPIAVLYDSVVTLCPSEERLIWRKAHDLFMHLANGWKYHGRVLRYPVDHELNKSWSWKPTDQELEEIEAISTDIEDHESIHQWLDERIGQVMDDENKSTQPMRWLWK